MREFVTPLQVLNNERVLMQYFVTYKCDISKVRVNKTIYGLTPEHYN